MFVTSHHVTNHFAGSTGQVSLHGSLPLAHRVQTLGSQFFVSHPPHTHLLAISTRTSRTCATDVTSPAETRSARQHRVVPRLSQRHCVPLLYGCLVSTARSPSFLFVCFHVLVGTCMHWGPGAHKTYRVVSRE